MAVSLALFSSFCIVLFEAITTYPKSITDPIVKKLCNQKDEVSKDRKELEELSTSLKTINMQDEFAKYSKIQRKINKLKDQLKSDVNDYVSQARKIHWFLVVLFYVTYAIFTIYCLYNYRSTLVIDLPANGFSPLDSILSYPSNDNGGISFFVWLLMIRYLSRRFLSSCTKVKT